MSHLSPHDLWSPGNNVVTAMPVSPGDILVYVTIGGKASFYFPIGEYSQAVNIAQAFARRLRSDPPTVIKVLPLSHTEAVALGFVPADIFNNHTGSPDAELRDSIRSTCLEALHNSPDTSVRADALNLLQNLGHLT